MKTAITEFFRTGSICIYILVLCVTILGGCAAVKPMPETTLPLDVNLVLAELKMRYDLVDTMRTWMNVSIESQGQEEELRAYFRYEKPDKLRVDAMGPFNDPRAVVLAVEKSFRIYFVTENELIEGELSDEVIKEVFNVDLRVSDVRSSVFANPFLDKNINDLETESYGDEYLIRRPSTRSGYREEISILVKDLVVNRWQIISAENELIQEIAFSKYRKIGGILRPLKAIISRPFDKTRISIESSNPEINVEMAEMTFNLPVPEGVAVYQLSDLKQHQNPDSDSEPNN